MAATSGAGIAHNAPVAVVVQVAVLAEAGQVVAAPGEADPAGASQAVAGPVVVGPVVVDREEADRAGGVRWGREIHAPHAVMALAFRMAHANHDRPSPTSSIRMIMY